MDRLYERAGPGPAVGSRRVDGAVAARSARARGLPVRVGRRRRRSAADGGAAARASERDRGAPVADARGGRHRRRRLAARRRLRRLARRGAPARLGPDVDLRGARALPREQPVRRPRRPRGQARAPPGRAAGNRRGRAEPGARRPDRPPAQLRELPRRPRHPRPDDLEAGLMRSDTLLFLHVLAGMVAVGGLIATGVVALERRRRPGPESGRGGRLAWQLPAGTVAATIVAIALGEGLAGQEDVSAAWLDVSRGLTVFGLV